MASSPGGTRCPKRLRHLQEGRRPQGTCDFVPQQVRHRRSPERVHLATRSRLSHAFLSSLTLANVRQHWALSSVRHRGLRGVSWCFGHREVEPLSRPRHSGHPGQPCPVPRRGTTVALVGAGAGCQVTQSGAQRVTARSRLGLRAGSPCSVLCLLAAASHRSARLPGAGAWGAGADVARDGSTASGPAPEVLLSLFLCSPCTTSPLTPGSIMRTSKCEYSWATVQTRGRWLGCGFSVPNRAPRQG